MKNGKEINRYTTSVVMPGTAVIAKPSMVDRPATQKGSRECGRQTCRFP